MPRPERALDPASGPVEEFAADLRRLRDKAGRPGYRELARRAHFSTTTLSVAAGGRQLPSLAVTLAYVRACDGDPAEWEERWRAVDRQLSGAGEDTLVGAADPVESAAPYRGLAAYEPEHAPWYFGRSRLVGELVDRLGGRRFLAVFGPSGSGKSSLLRAGLLPEVRDGALSSGVRWPAILLTPGRRPLPSWPCSWASWPRCRPARCWRT